MTELHNYYELVGNKHTNKKNTNIYLYIYYVYIIRIYVIVIVIIWNSSVQFHHDFTHRIPGPLARDGHWRNTFELLEQGRVCRIDTPQATRSWAVNACKEALQTSADATG